MVAEGYKDTEIGVIPVEWEVVRLEAISKITMGQSPKSDTYNIDNIGMPLIQGNADCKNRKTIPRTYTTELTKECFVGDIIMTVRAPVGAISKSLHNACIGRGVCSIKSKEDNEYIYHCLVNYEDNWDKLSQGSTFTAVSASDIKNLKIPLPPLKEQKKIADILSTADAKIDAVALQIEKAETLKKGLLQKLLSEGIGHSEFKDSDIGVIPVEWEVKYVKDIAKIITGKKDTQNKEEGGKYPFFVRSQTIERINSYSFDGEAVLTAGDGVGVGKIYHYLNEKFDYHQRVYNIHNFSDDVNGRYFYEYFKAKFYSRVSRMSAKNSVDSVRLDMIAKMEIPFPPLEEQKQIADILSTADEKLEVLRAKKQMYETLKEGLLQKLLSGEVRV